MNFDGKNIVFLDFESFYDSKNGLGFKDQSCVEYVRDPRFKAHGLAWQCDNWVNKDVVWVSGSKLPLVLSDTDLSDSVVVSHNIKFDGAILAWHYKVKPYAWFDTVALAKAVLGENVSNYHLKGLAEYLGLQSKGELKWNGVRDLTPEQEAEMAEYCKGDTVICKGIYEKLIGQLPVSQLWSIDWTIRAFVEPKLCLSESVLVQGVQNEKNRREEVIAKSGIEKSVLASNKQFAELLSQRGMAVPTKTSGRTGKEIPAFAKTDGGLTELQQTSPELYHARIASKANLLETRGTSLLSVAKTGPFPFDVGFSGAVQTHRYSGGNGAGGNPQNFTRKSFLREAVYAPEGYSLVVGDFAAIELRILAWLAKEPLLINKLINDEDVYADFASILYGRKITKADPERVFGKEAILGLGYNMGADKFKDRVKTVLKQEISDDEAWKTVSLYRTTYQNVPKLWAACSSIIPLVAEGRISSLYFAPFLRVRKGAIILPSGLAVRYPNLRPVIVQGRRGPKTEWVYDKFKKKYESEPVKLYGGKMVENICQALAGELCKEAIERAETSGLTCVGQVHDELLVLSRQDSIRGEQEAETVRRLQAAMEQSPKWMANLRLKAEVGYGKNWNTAKN